MLAVKVEAMQRGELASAYRKLSQETEKPRLNCSHLSASIIAMSARNDHVCGSHLSQKTRKMGHPRSIWCGRNHNQCQGQRTGVSVPHGQRQRQLQDRSCGRLWFPPFAKDA